MSWFFVLLFLTSSSELFAVDNVENKEVVEVVEVLEVLEVAEVADNEKKAKKKKKESKRTKRRKAIENIDREELRRPKQYRIINGVLTDVVIDTSKVSSITPDKVVSDTVELVNREVDSLAISSLDGFALFPDSLESVNLSLDTLEQKKGLFAKWEALKADTTRHSVLVKDSISVSRLCYMSLVLPGFGQYYNKQAWKIPILYTAVGTAFGFGIQQNNKYSTYKSEYDAMLRRNASRDELTPVQTKMIQHNTYRQILFMTAAASYIYFIGDVAMNYDGTVSNIKKATTLSTICPGAGQFYNKSYWKVPIVLGGLATMAYIIDFNSRGLKRFQLAYDLKTDGDDSTVDEFNGRYEADVLKNFRNSYRRNRDLSIIFTGLFYLLNIVDAHVDAHFQDYDISDDLTVDIVPILSRVSSQSRGSQDLLGMGINFRF